MRALERDGLGLVGPHGDAAVAADRDALVHTHILAAVGPDRDLLVDVDPLAAVLVDGDRLVLVHRLGALAVDGDGLVVVDRLGAVVLDVGGLVVVDGLHAVVPDPVRLVVLDLDVLVLLGVDPELLAALLVLEANGVGVGAAAAERGARQHAGLGLVGGQFPGRHLLGVVDAAGDERSVGVALQELDHHLLADARHRHHAEVLARPRMRHADPARGVLVVLAVAVPVEVHLHPAVLVGVDLVAGGADHDRRLQALHQRLARGALGAERQVAGDAVEAAAKARPLSTTGLMRGEHEIEAARSDQILAVLVLAWLLLELEHAARRDPTRIAGPLHDLHLRLQFLQADAYVGLALALAVVFARVVVDLVLRFGVVALVSGLLQQLDARLLEVEVVDGVRPRLHLPGKAPFGDPLPLDAQRALAADEGELRVARVRLVRARRIAQHRGVLAVLVGEVVVDPLLLHQPADEVEVGLAVLHAVFPRLVRAREAIELVGGDRVLAEDLLDDLGHLLILEDAAVRAAGEEPQPGPPHDAIAQVAPKHSHEREGRHVGIEVALATVGQLDPDRHVVPEQLVRVDVVALAQHIDLVFEEPTEFLARGDRVKEQHSVTERRGDLHDPRHTVPLWALMHSF